MTESGTTRPRAGELLTDAEAEAVRSNALEVAQRLALSLPEARDTDEAVLLQLRAMARDVRLLLRKRRTARIVRRLVYVAGWVALVAASLLQPDDGYPIPVEVVLGFLILAWIVWGVLGVIVYLVARIVRRPKVMAARQLWLDTTQPVVKEWLEEHPRARPETQQPQPDLLASVPSVPRAARPAPQPFGVSHQGAEPLSPRGCDTLAQRTSR